MFVRALNELDAALIALFILCSSALGRKMVSKDMILPNF